MDVQVSSPEDLLSLFKAMQTTDNQAIQMASDVLTRMMKESPIQLVCLSSRILLSDDVPISAVQQAAILIGRVFTPKPLFPITEVLKMWQRLGDDSERATIKMGLFRGLMYDQQTVRESSAYSIVTILKADAGDKRWTDFYEKIFQLIFEDYGNWAKLGAMYTLGLVFQETRMKIVPPDDQLSGIVAKLFEFAMNLVVTAKGLLRGELVDKMMAALVQQAGDGDCKYARKVCELIVVVLRLFPESIARYMAGVFEFLKAQFASQDADRQRTALFLVLDITHIDHAQAVVEQLTKALAPVLLMMLSTVEADKDDCDSPRYELAKDCMRSFASWGYGQVVFSHCSEMCMKNLASAAWPMRFAAIYCNKCFLYDTNTGPYTSYLGELVGQLVNSAKDSEGIVAKTAIKMIARIIKYAQDLVRAPDFIPRIVEFVVQLLNQGPELANAATSIVRAFASNCNRRSPETAVDPWFERLAVPMFDLMNSPKAVPHFNLVYHLSLALGSLIDKLSSAGARLVIPMYESLVTKTQFVLSSEFAWKLQQMYPQLNCMAATQELLSSLFFVENTIIKAIGYWKWQNSSPELGSAIMTISKRAMDMLFVILENSRSLYIAESLSMETINTLVLTMPDMFNDGFDGLKKCLLAELGSPSQEVVVEAVQLVGDLFTKLPHHMALHHNEFMSKVFEKLSDSNLIVSNVPPMFYTVGDIIAVLPEADGWQYIETTMNLYRLFMATDNKDVGIRKDILRSLLNVARGIVKTYGKTNNPDVKRMLRTNRIAMFWPIAQLNNPELCDQRTLEMGLSFLEFVVSSPVAKSSFAIELNKHARIVLDAIAARNPPMPMKIRVDKIRRALRNQ